MTLKSTTLRVGEPVDDPTIDLFLRDKRHSDDWRDEAIESYDFVAGRQYTKKEIDYLKSKNRPPVVFNRTKTVIDAISGNEIGNRREVRYIPREMGDVKANEVYTAAGAWFRDQSHADESDTDAFSDMLICGMGWTETRIDFDTDDDGKPSIDRADPLEFAWDKDAKKRNLIDAKRIWHFKSVPLSEVQHMFEDRSQGEIDADWTQATSAKDYGYNNESMFEDGDSGTANDPRVTIVRVQWLEREKYIEARDPLTGQKADFTPEEFETANRRLTQLVGMPMQGRERSRLVRMQAWLGRVVLSVSRAPSQKGFSWSCITGYRDRNQNLWYGMMRAMKDPQRWANKWLSQMMHILNTNAKGGLMAEKGAFENVRQAEESWAHPDKITWTKDGAIQNQRIKEKTAATFPAGFQQLTEFGVSSIRDVTGVSLEVLGMREADQAASLEYQRRQAGMMILQPLFDGLKLYREIQGAVMLDYIQNDLADGRLIRIVGEEKEQFIPLLKQAEAEYDIIVDDAPTSPNQKEMVWQIIMQMLPVLGKTIPPQLMIGMMKYSPLPSDVVDGIMKQMNKPPSPMQQMQQQMQMEAAKAEIEKTRSETAENVAQAQKYASEGGGEAEMAKIAVDARLRQAENQQDRDLAMQQMLGEFDLKQREINAEIAIKREKNALDAMMKPAPASSVRFGGDAG